MNAKIVLEDGKIFPGKSIGVKKKEVFGELMFDTRVVGYQEILTDPAQVDKILVFTYPLIGNYGVNDKFNESGRAWVNAVVIKKGSRISSNWQARGSFSDFLKQQKLMGISGVDTRTLTVHLRNRGRLWAAISLNGKDPKSLIAKIKSHKKRSTFSRTKEISVKQITEVKPETQSRGAKKYKGLATRIGILDLGVRKSLISQLVDLGSCLVLLPHDTNPAQLLKLKLDGLVISSGPEEDPALKVVTETVGKLIGKIPLLGIVTGYQVIARAMGAKIKRMNTGHNGVNYPVIAPKAKKGEITVQNHNFVVDKDSLKKTKGLKVSLLNLNDGTIEAIESSNLKLIGLQYYPSSPGFNQPHGELERFLNLCR
jgi:carbamoyl-phosphate synthase small subunit